MNQMIKNLKKYSFLLRELVKKTIKLRYRRSYLGILWTLIEPLLTMIVLTIVFGQLLGRDSTDAAFAGVPYPIYVLSGRLLYSFFSSATNASMKSIRNNASMIKKVYVPKYIYPVSGVIANFLIFLISLIVLAGVVVFFLVRGDYQAPINGYMLLSVVPLINLFVLGIGVGILLSTMCVFFRDMEYLWSVLLMLIMYCSAIFYFPDRLGEEAVMLLKLNPLYGIIHNFRVSFFGHPFDGTLMLYTWGVALAVLGIGLYAFYRKQDKFILYI
ncbi:MAG: ABC transporter permease [Eubacterium sp.]|nr:ABC transporter permease [Eubacterium sp.]